MGTIKVTASDITTSLNLLWLSVKSKKARKEIDNIISQEKKLNAELDEQRIKAYEYNGLDDDNVKAALDNIALLLD